MLPLTDHNPRRTFPFVTYAFIALNVLAFFWELSLGIWLIVRGFNRSAVARLQRESQ